MRAYKGKPTFGGVYDEDREAVAENYAETAESCDATEYEKCKAKSFMLSGRARMLFHRKGKDFKTFEQGMELLRSWYNSADKQGRLLTEWHGMSLTWSMEDRPDESQKTGFRSFAAHLVSLQNKLEKGYHTDRYLRDRLMSAVDIPEMQNALRDGVTPTSHPIINRVANRMSTRKGSHRNEAHIARQEEEDE